MARCDTMYVFSMFFFVLFIFLKLGYTKVKANRVMPTSKTTNATDETGKLQQGGKDSRMQIPILTNHPLYPHSQLHQL